jgi:hypothetical protein
MSTHFIITDATGNQTTISTTGRDQWALECLIEAGPKGCTPLDQPGPRWSAYVFNLRALGLEIETVTERHDGPFKGHHARYVLRSHVAPVNQTGRAA